MDFIQYTAEKFLKSQEEVVKRLMEEGEMKLRQGWPEAKAAIGQELFEKIAQLYQDYKRLQRERQTGPLEYVHISFLRTGVLLQDAWYRIDFYDRNGQLSEVECFADWQPQILSEIIAQAEKALTANFMKQSSAGLYECKRFVLRIAEHLHSVFGSLFTEIFSMREESAERAIEEAVRVHIGEFLDDSQEVYNGRL